MGRKYGYHYLDEEHKQFAEKNFNLVWFYIGRIVKQRIIEPREIDEFSGYAILLYCQACETFDFSRGYKPSTYIFKALHSSLCRYKDYTNRFLDRFLVVDFSAQEDDEYVPNRIEPVYDDVKRNFVVSDKVHKLMNDSGLDQREIQMIYYKYNLDLDNLDISKIFNVPSYKINKMVDDIIQKLKIFVSTNRYNFEDFLEESAA